LLKTIEDGRRIFVQNFCFIFLFFLFFSYGVLKYTYREEALREQAEKLAQRMVDIGLGQGLVYYSRSPLISFKHFLRV